MSVARLRYSGFGGCGIRHVASEEDHREVRNKEGGDLSKIQGGHVDGVGPDTRHPFVIRNYRVWSSQWAFHGGSPNVLLVAIVAFVLGRRRRLVR